MRLSWCQLSVLTVLLFLNCHISNTERAKRDVYFSFVTALTGSPLSSGGVPVIDFALEQINNDSRLLQDYNLQYTTIMDSQCDTTIALESFLQHFDSESQPTYITSMCCGCSSATIPVAEISHHWNVPHISFASSAPLLNNRRRFKSFFHTLPCYVYEPRTIETMMKEYSWSRMAVINQDESPLDSVAQGLDEIFQRHGWTLGQTVTIGSSPNQENVAIDYGQLLQWEEDFRIIMINTFEDHTYHILCEAYHKYGERLLNQEIVLIMHGRYMTEWWESTAHQTLNSSCTRDEIMMALNNTLALTPETYDLIENTSTVAFSGITPTEFTNTYLSLLNEERYSNYTPLNFFGSAYDAMWVVAYGLDLVDRWWKNGTIIDECESLAGELLPLHNFSYTNARMGCYLRTAFHRVDILGITGPVEFRADGARPDNIVRLRQNRVKTEEESYRVSRPTVARVNNIVTGDFTSVYVQYIDGESESTIWPGGVAPYDGSSQDVLNGTHLAITIILCVLGAIGVGFVIVSFIFNLIFRNKRVVKLGSPNLNFLIIAGAALLYLAMFFYAISARDLTQQFMETILCNFRFWLFSVGNSLCFAVILAKQWRIYYIFSNPTPNKKAMRDWMLVIMVVVIVGIELVVVTIGTAVPESRLKANATIIQELRENEGVNERVFLFICGGETATIWIAISFGYKALLQLVAIFMAFTTRKVRVKGLNDTKELYTNIYINTVIITALIVIEFALRSHRDVYFTLYGLAIFAGATLFLGMTFIPKMILLRKDPNGENVFSGYDTNHLTLERDSVQLNSLSIPEVQAKIAQLQKRLAFLENAQSSNDGKKEVPFRSVSSESNIL